MQWVLRRLSTSRFDQPKAHLPHLRFDAEPIAAFSESDASSSDNSATSEAVPTIDGTSRGIVYNADDDLIMTVAELYHRLQNLSHYPRSLPLARRYLLNMLTDSMATAAADDSHCILSLPSRFEADALAVWLTSETERTTARYGGYVERRRAGGRREMFEDRADAERWCRESAVVKYVDGAWLQGTLRSTTGLASATLDAVNAVRGQPSTSATKLEDLEPDWRAARVSWQVLSEELGDGDLDRCHVDAYQRLMDGFVDACAPRGHHVDFLSWLADNVELEDQPNKQPCVAALLQLTTSAAPGEFLPEILGFNLSYEGLPYHLLVTARELKELGIDPLYFVLHISIDNSESGHSAMARLAVEAYLHAAEAAHGPEVSDLLWRRVQAGYILADTVRTTPTLRSEPAEVDDPAAWTRGIPVCEEDVDRPATSSTDEALTASSTDLLVLFRRKAAASRGLHASAAARLGGRPISEWLTPEVMDAEGTTFINALANSVMWIARGEPPEKSRLYREFLYGGRMFGAFTRSETAAFRKWIELLPAGEDPVDAFPCAIDDELPPLPTAEALERRLADPYWRFVYGNRFGPQRDASSGLAPVDLAPLLRDVKSWTSWQDVAPDVYRDVLSRPDALRHWPGVDTASLLRSLVAEPITPITTVADLIPRTLDALDPADLEATYYLSTAPIEWLASSSPARLASPLAMAIIKAMRCLYGFSESDLADGLDPGCLGTDDVLTMAEGVRDLGPALFGSASPPSLRSFDRTRALALPALILALNSRPTLFLPYLLGLAYALNIGLHTSLANGTLGTEAARTRLAVLTRRSRRWLVEAIETGVEAERTGADLVCWDAGVVGWGEGVAIGYELGWRGLSGSATTKGPARGG